MSGVGGENTGSNDSESGDNRGSREEKLVHTCGMEKPLLTRDVNARVLVLPLGKGHIRERVHRVHGELRILSSGVPIWFFVWNSHVHVREAIPNV